MLPMLIFIIILLGAIAVQYPAQTYPNGTFQDNTNKSFSTVMDVTSNAIQKLVMMFYDLGRANPVLWMIIAVVFIVMSLWHLKRNVNKHIWSNMDAQELIHSLTKKDFIDLEKYEQKLAKRKPHWWNKK